MDERHAKILAPIIKLCKDIISNDSSDACIKELIKKITTKDAAFYQCHTYTNLLKLLKENPNLEANKVSHVFKVLDLILNDERSKKSKKYFATQFYNYFIKLNEETPDIYIEESLNLLKVTPETEEELFDIHLCMIQKCLSCSKFINNKTYVDIINENFRQLMRNDLGENQVKLLQMMSKIVYSYYKNTKSWTLSIDFLQNSLYQELKTSDMKIKNNEEFLEYINVINTIIVYSKNSDMLKVCCKIIAESHKFFDEKEHKILNKVLHKSLTNMPYSTITEKAMSDVYQSYFKDSKSSTANIIQHKVIDIVQKHFMSVTMHLEKSSKCVQTCHNFVFSLFNLLKYIKSKDNDCCADLKRHSIFNLCIEMAKYISSVMESKIFTKEIEKYLTYYLDYALSIYNEIKCPTKQPLYRILRGATYDVLATLFNEHKDVLFNDLKKFTRIYKIMVNLKESEEDEQTVKYLINLGLCMSSISYDETEKNSESYAEIITYLIIYTLKNNNPDYLAKLPKLITKLRSAVLKINYSSVVDYFKKNLKSSDLDAHIDEIILLELKTLSRYDSQNIDGIVELFKMIYEKTDNLELFGCACLSINDRVLKAIDMKKFKGLHERLEQYKSDNIQISIGLALNNYYLYCIENEKMEKEIAEALKKSKNDHPSCLTLESEVKILNILDKFLDHAIDVLLKIKKDSKEMEKIPSMKAFTSILENVSTQYFVRGIANKDLETKLVLWNLLQYDKDKHLDLVVDTAAFFLDNLDRMIGSTGHYLAVSKRLNYVRAEEIIQSANPVLETLLKDIESKHERQQVRPMNYMLSLWVHYAINGRKDDSLNMWRKFDETRKICNLQAPLYVGTIDAKKHMAIVEISLKCFKRNAADHIYRALKHLQKITTVYADYSNNFQFLYRNIILKAINYSMNRMIDVDHYVTCMMLLKSQAVQKGLFIKNLDLLSLSAVRNLNTEKLDDAKTDLKKMSVMLKLEDDVLIETPISTKASSQTIEVQNNEITVRKAIPKPSDHKSRIEIFNDSFDNTRSLIEQLRNFVHDYSCKCSLCEFPHLKFILFQMGCHYSRLLFLMEKFDVSKSFNEYALGPWRYCSVKVLRTKDNAVFNINKKEFITFSIRWLFQVVDSFVMTKDYSKIDEILTEVELLCTSNIEDYECIRQALHARLENLEFLTQHGETFFKETEEKSLNFEDFIKSRVPKSSSSVLLTVKNPEPTAHTRKKSPQSEPSKKTQKATTSKVNKIDSIIYIDSDDSDKEVRAKPPKKVASVPAKSTRATKKVPEADTTVEKPRTRLRKYLE